MKKLKFLKFSLITLFVFVLQISSSLTMEEYIMYEQNKLKQSAKYTENKSHNIDNEDKLKERTILEKRGDQKDEVKSDDECCTHWGLKRWVYGIKEYIIDRCICCTMCGFNHMDEDRAYQDNFAYGITTDCCCVASTPWGTGCLHNNPITGTLCFPLATTTHLLLLPCACCSCKRDMCYGNESPEKKLREKECGRETKPSYSSRYGGSYGGTYSNTESSYSPYHGKGNTTLYDGGFDGRNCPYYAGGLRAKYEYSTSGARCYMEPYSAHYCYHCGQIHKLDRL